MKQMYSMIIYDFNNWGQDNVPIRNPTENIDPLRDPVDANPTR